MGSTVLWFAFACYLAGTAGFVCYLCFRRSGLARVALGIVAAGFALHAVSYGLDCAATRAMVITSARGSFSLLSFLTALVFLATSFRHQLHILGAFVMPLILLAAGVAAVALPAVPPAAVLQGPLFPLHVVLNFAALAGFVTAFGVAVAYLIQEGQIKSRRPNSIAYVLPPLEVLDRLSFRIVAVSLLLLGAGIAVGMVYVSRSQGAYWSQDPKVYATIASFLIYAAAVFVRLFLGWRGRRMALLLIAGFVFVFVTFIGMHHALPRFVLGI